MGKGTKTKKKTSVRKDDLSFIRGRLKEISRRVATLNADIGTERQICNDDLQELLRNANLFDKFKEIEERRDKAVAEMQKEQQQLQAEANELGNAQRFIKKRLQSAPGSALSAAALAGPKSSKAKKAAKAAAKAAKAAEAAAKAAEEELAAEAQANGNHPEDEIDPDEEVELDEDSDDGEE